MLVTRIKQSVVAAVVVAATMAGSVGFFGALSTPASAATPDSGTSNAYGILVKLLGGALVGPMPAVTLGANGQDSGLKQTLPIAVGGVATANTINVDASSTNFGTAAEQISAVAGTEGLQTLKGISLLNTLINITAVNTNCNSNADGSTGATQIVGLQIGNAAPVNLPSNIPPNSGLTAAQLGPLAGLVTIELNKQTVNDRSLTLDGTNIDVIGVEITLLSALGGGVVIDVSHTFCQATGSDIEAPPNVTSVVPNFGPVAGGTPVTITGTGFIPTSQVQFGGRDATNVHYVSSTVMTANSPVPAITNANSTVGVTVSNTHGFGPVPSGPANDFTYDFTPGPLTIVPVTGPTTGGQMFKITGINLGPDSTVAFGTGGADDALATNIVVDPPGTVTKGTVITGVTPPHAAGLVQVAVADSGGLGLVPGGYTYILAPVTVNSINPDDGPTAGGTTVTITGTGFSSSSTATFGGAASTFVSESGPPGGVDTLVVTDPPHAAGTVDVIVTTPTIGTSFAVVQDQFTYVSPPNVPSNTNLVPDFGPTAGGTTVVITGTGLTDVTSVIFGAATCTSSGGTGGAAVAPANITNNTTDTSVTVVTPAHAAGAVPLCITSAGGTASTGTTTFTFVPPPSGLAGPNPTAGPTAGGTHFTITGSDLTAGVGPATTVTFEDNGSPLTQAQATGVSVTGTNPNETLTGVTPPGIAGPATVIVTTVGGATTAPNLFNYLGPPNVPGPNGISPLFGPDTGGTTVTITGSGLTGISKVNFGGSCNSSGSSGGAVGTSLTPISDSTATVKTPPSPDGPAVVCITATGGTAPAVQPFTFESNPPKATGINPAGGPVGGGTTVTITGSGFGVGDPNTTVSFGANLGTSVNVVSQTQITVVTPASTLAGDGHGPVNVTVSDSAGGPSTPPLVFTYFIQPVITGISPTSGPLGGGETVIIKGSGLCGATSVPFGPNNATIVSNTVDCMQLNVTEPAGNGTVPVYVITPGGTARSPEDFTYITPGYWLAASDGGVFAFGGARFLGSVPGVLKPGQVLNSPIVAMADTPDHGGYWLFAADGGTFTFGDANFFGSVPGVLKPGQVLNGPVVTAEATPDGQGYRLFAADGGVFDFGDASYEGSLPGRNVFPTSPVAGATAYPFKDVIPPAPGSPSDNAGYWLVLANGGVYSFGNAPNNIGTGQGQIFGKVVALATTPTGEGYYMFLQGGPVAHFGDADNGLPGVNTGGVPVVFGQATSTGHGYWVFTSNGGVFISGDAPNEGSAASQGIQLNKPITAAIAFGATP